MPVRVRRIARNEVWWLVDEPGGHPDPPESVAAIEARLAGRFRFVEATPLTDGLRAPQLGALHAILAEDSLGTAKPITIVLPTGTGKTETMLAVYCHRPMRTLVVVPSDSLRTQIGNKFATLGFLPLVGAVDGDYLAPSVGIVKSRLETAADAQQLVDSAAVIVATSSVLSRCTEEALGVLNGAVGRLFIDEAHHVAARTWSEITERFTGKPIVQFTATPFREDGRVLEGRIVYAYPLRLAQENEWFATINYRSVTAAGDIDRELAAAAVQQLRDDLTAGYDHLVMGRVQSIPRAEALLEIYTELAPDLGPVRIDSRLSASRQREAKSRLDARTSRIVVCVDMLGEGFDLPALKIAAVHDPHKASL